MLLFILSYIYIYDLTVKDRSWGVHSYKNFLLENTNKFPRIIFDSGSNIHHSINSKMVEQEFNRVTINLGDNGGYPLKYKLLRLAKYSRPNDIVILPLEYPHYSYHDIPKTFYDNIFGSLSFYYLALDLIDKIDFIAQTPFSTLVYSLFEEKRYIDNSYYFLNLFNDGERGDLNFINKTPADLGTRSVSCEMYILAIPIEYNFALSDTFKKNISLIKLIEKEKKIKFIFTYPTVVGDDCYNGKYREEIKWFIQNIKSFLGENNIPILGEPKDSSFPKKYMNNTYYHVLPEARDIRTKRLIESIKKSDIYPIFKENYSIDYKLSYKDLASYKNIKTIELDKQISFSAKYINSNLQLLSGWYQKEPWGVWSRGEKSKLAVKVDRDRLPNGISMTIKARVFGNKSKTKILINGKVLGEYSLHGMHNIKIKESFLDKDILTIEFHNKDIVPPKNDGRKLKLGLESIKFESHNK